MSVHLGLTHTVVCSLQKVNLAKGANGGYSPTDSLLSKPRLGGSISRTVLVDSAKHTVLRNVSQPKS